MNINLYASVRSGVGESFACLLSLFSAKVGGYPIQVQCPAKALNPPTGFLWSPTGRKPKHFTESLASPIFHT